VSNKRLKRARCVKVPERKRERSSQGRHHVQKRDSPLEAGGWGGGGESAIGSGKKKITLDVAKREKGKGGSK